MNNELHLIMMHYEYVWGNKGVARRWLAGPIGDLPRDFQIAEFGPSSARNMWTYATCGMSYVTNRVDSRIELHLFSPQQDESLVELLTVVAHYHLTGASLGLGHTVDFGRPWLRGSGCDKGLISLPYLDGPALETLRLGNDMVRCLWLVPITASELSYAKSCGIDALEAKLEQVSVDYVNPLRLAVV